jgi:hypothetical protein
MKKILGEAPKKNMVMTFQKPLHGILLEPWYGFCISPLIPPQKMTPYRLLSIVSILAIGLTVMTPDAEAAPLPLDSGWTILDSSPNDENVPVPVPGSPYVFSGGPWVINAITPFKLSVTDLYTPGDLFEVWNSGSLLGSGSTPNGFYSFITNPDLALSSPIFSHNSWTLQPGAYSLLFKVTKFAPNTQSTQIAFKAERQHVPDGGSTALLLGMALAGIAAIRKFQCSACRP